ncbi:hypothetical protein AAX05_09395 [Moraxella bovoculi]|uniref:DUF1877 family protein n=1 Tax=Moraxella bovoculi TaxID=386891 RepID=A0AAC8PWV6_9GAMM|nr:hypothetical protein [Moraxella bovoculi]AKG08473.1 hypothetical protein AAX06_10385 [Moraxella bovoculi]AKG10310.1 hypothetical protein AAX05_09395 [Moraxella bovoculi]AKG12335.1 hypothetical protein AAX07_10630 [Moraxella bovoculi]AKG14296.1 hypothetical protein AAX11_10080 [Moraxella bovoculi]
MINFDFYISHEKVGGLNFQICYSISGEIVYENSLVINEDLFSLIEDDFSLCYDCNTKKHEYYHWGINFHDGKDAIDIEKRLYYRLDKLKKNLVKDLDYHWLDNDCVNYLEINKKNFENFIIYVINFINNNQIKGRDGLYVIGI